MIFQRARSYRIGILSPPCDTMADFRAFFPRVEKHRDFACKRCRWRIHCSHQSKYARDHSQKLRPTIAQRGSTHSNERGATMHRIIRISLVLTAVFCLVAAWQFAGPAAAQEKIDKAEA